jgi:hypothetical protein
MNHRRLSLILPSTRSFFREGLRTPGYRLIDFLHGYAYARWPYLYIGIGVGEHPISPRLKQFSRLFTRLFPPRPAGNGNGSKPSNVAFADTYHGKVVPLSAATQLVTVREVRLPELEKIIPYDRVRDII